MVETVEPTIVSEPTGMLSLKGKGGNKHLRLSDDSSDSTSSSDSEGSGGSGGSGGKGQLKKNLDTQLTEELMLAQTGAMNPEEVADLQKLIDAQKAKIAKMKHQKLQRG